MRACVCFLFLVLLLSKCVTQLKSYQKFILPMLPTPAQTKPNSSESRRTLSLSLPMSDAPHVYVHAWTLCRFHNESYLVPEPFGER